MCLALQGLAGDRQASRAQAPISQLTSRELPVTLSSCVHPMSCLLFIMHPMTCSPPAACTTFRTYL